jgi:hypothetical protein
VPGMSNDHDRDQNDYETIKKSDEAKQIYEDTIKDIPNIFNSILTNLFSLITFLVVPR